MLIERVYGIDKQNELPPKTEGKNIEYSNKEDDEINIKLNIQENVKMYGDKQDIEHIHIQVKNIGDPIPEEEREKIFERFYRVDKARNRNEKRYGLGLAIAKSTAEKYNGTLV